MLIHIQEWTSDDDMMAAVVNTENPVLVIRGTFSNIFFFFYFNTFYFTNDFLF